MDADDEEPGSAGPPHPSVFYGLWPRFLADEDAGGPHDAKQAPSMAE